MRFGGLVNYAQNSLEKHKSHKYALLKKKADADTVLFSTIQTGTYTLN